jgi:hypothetical protein
LVEISWLPSSLEWLRADRQVLINFDFSLVPKMSKLWVYNGKTEQHELKNLPKLGYFEGNCKR